MDNKDQTDKERNGEQVLSANQEVKSTQSEPPSTSTRNQSPVLIFRMTPDRFAEVMLAFAITVFTGALWWTSTDQVTVMREQTAAMEVQLAEMKSAGAETEKLIAATEKIAEATKNSVAQSKAALDATIEAVRLEQRAWVGATSVIHPLKYEGGGPKLIKEGSRPSFGVVITNTGKTPARKMKGMISSRGFPKGEPFSAVYDVKGKPVSKGVLNPGGKNELYTINVSKPLTIADVESLTSERQILYVYGILTYEDIFSVKHESTFCYYLSPNLTTLNLCDRYNDAT